MPLVQSRRPGGWMDAQAAAAAPRAPSLARAWPSELPGPAQLPPRQPDAPGTRPMRGWPNRVDLGLSASSTGNPANADGRASVYGIPL